MSDKVNLTKAQADAVERSKELDKEMVVRRHSLDEAGTAWTEEYAPLNDLSLNTLIKALYIGYEVEESPEDKVREYYEAYHAEHNADFRYGLQLGICFVLNTLNIKIEGVNT